MIAYTMPSRLADQKDDYRLFCMLSHVCASIGISTGFESDVYPIVRQIIPHEYFALLIVSISRVASLSVININFPPIYIPQISPYQPGTTSLLFENWMSTHAPQHYEKAMGPAAGPLDSRARCLPIRNMITHGIMDTNGSAATYAIFANVRPKWNAATKSCVEMLCPHLHTAAAYSRRTRFSPIIDQANLTVREQHILTLLCRGLGRTEIAQEARISPWTAKVHIKNILRKLPAKNSRHAVAIALGSEGSIPLTRA